MNLRDFLTENADSLKETIKPLAVAASGMIAIQLPEWLEWLNKLLGVFTGFYQFIVFALTSTYLCYRIYNERKRANED